MYIYSRSFCPQPFFYGEAATQTTCVFTGWRNTKDPKSVGNPEEEQRQRTNQPNGLPPMPLGIWFLLVVLVVVVVVVVVKYHAHFPCMCHTYFTYILLTYFGSR